MPSVPHAAPSPNSDFLARAATLRVPPPNGPPGFDGVAISASIVVGHSVPANAGMPSLGPETGLWLFTRPASGWRTEGPAAHLVPTTSTRLEPVAISGDTVFAGAADYYGPGIGAVYVFTKPPGGWRGTVHESATLMASDATSQTLLGGHIAVSGRTVYASGGGAIYAFTEPSGGWTGTIHESGKLTAPNGGRFALDGVSGSTLVAGVLGPTSDSGPTDTFLLPPPHTSGVLNPEGSLVVPDPRSRILSAAIAGSTIAAQVRGAYAGDGFYGAVDIFSAPDWVGAIEPVAERRAPVSEDTGGPYVAAGPDSVAGMLSLPSFSHMCPCEGEISAFTAGRDGWGVDGAFLPPGATSGSGGMAIDGRLLAAGSDGGVALFKMLPRPSVSGSSLAGLAAGRPQIRVRVSGNAGSDSIQSMTLSAPDGVRFLDRPRVLQRAVHLSGGRGGSVRLSHGHLVVTLRTAVQNVVVTVGRSGLIESSRLRRAADAVHAFNRQHRRKHALPLPASLSVNDSAGDATTFTLPFAVT